MSEDEHCRIWCLLHRKGQQPFPVDASLKWNIAQLKKAIWQEKKVLRKFDATEFSLWKLKDPTLVEPIATLADRVNSQTVVELKAPTRKVSDVFPDHPEDRLQIIVGPPSSPNVRSQATHLCSSAGKRSTKRRKLNPVPSTIVPEDMKKLWDETWNRKEESVPWFTLMKIERDYTSSEVVPEYCWILSPPKYIAEALGLKPKIVLFRDDYLRALGELFQSSGLGIFTATLGRNPGAIFPNFFSGVQVPQMTPDNGFILTGNPGIGKSIFLRILLILRLSARLPTFYATSATTVFLFTKEGPEEIPLTSRNLRFRLLDVPTSWALFDSTRSLMEPPEIFVESSDIFVVQTPSPRLERIEWRKKDPPIKLFCLELWSNAELICAAPFQNRRHEEQALVKFADRYGYSARDVYGNASTIDDFELTLRAYCKQLSYDDAAKIASEVHILHFPKDVTHNIFCIFPTDVGLRYSFDFASKHVYNCLLESLQNSQADAAANLYRLFLRLGKTQDAAGYMFELAAHYILSNGGNFQIIPLEESKGRKHTHWKTPKNLFEQVPKYLCFTSKGISVKGEAGKEHVGGQPRVFDLPPKKRPFENFGYYCPSPQSQATYDGVAYDPKHKHARIFQITTSGKHTVKVKGMQDLLDRGVEKISYFAVTPADITIDFPASKKANDIVLHKFQLCLQ